MARDDTARDFDCETALDRRSDLQLAGAPPATVGGAETAAGTPAVSSSGTLSDFAIETQRTAAGTGASSSEVQYGS
ncbi:hypothetical protein [Halorussus ruber]|uniref:hypothetical protein n=1 Tax=Halorussus ruber TaxID=1126238 RepID=UPI0010923292|nr:hypothetical protein [Halorussus ruber]